ncbi:MAG: methyltransferase type 11, partial [Planctomycetes bacterium]|nr:methyltransferase type 11 [Planctomycetota bacterium]
MKLLELLRLPETRNIEDIDDPSTTALHGEIIRRKPFLRKLYRDFYGEFQKAIPEYANKVIVEIGSGGGFLKEVIPNATTSDVFDLPDIDMVFSALEMPFEDSSIDAIV